MRGLRRIGDVGHARRPGGTTRRMRSADELRVVDAVRELQPLDALELVRPPALAEQLVAQLHHAQALRGRRFGTS